ncbi:hypothetical protein FOG51_00663 [Hanseniaspora uvarum]|uniref:Exosome complex component RRP4 n=1 Tax=Hanseniaspora uvarum TaxID=29833 RepID=A0A1E5RXQ2_HANUV|nr:hypothetical protein FOG48_00492 [Hanseniaspora uvarum]KAF0274437.1 hypothetical protein FOG51_00663 [Hanseniaspora uvarum]KAF0278412.1 hypothetical protein FOG50_00767 [Hanseniaspora uvarum]KKA03390.1 Exosome complex component HuRRP4 [Hanseniaspora uvarum DSM 2768]OEJ91704.1 Exosome complex component RRP4 [Hanseniaspora uvarum]
MSAGNKILNVITHLNGNGVNETNFGLSNEAKEIYNFESSDEDIDMTSDSDDEVVENKKLVNQMIVPGDLVIKSNEYMKGHNTYTTEDLRPEVFASEENQKEDEINIYSSTLGVISKINKLISIENVNKNLYMAEIGDHIIGQIVEVTSAKKWKLNINGNNLATLQLSSINLPGGLLRRKNEQDELNMKQLLKVGDLINCEVQGVYANRNDVHLHTRSLNYGKLRNGALVKVKMGLIQRKKTHTHFFNNNSIKIILGCNCFIWISHEKPNQVNNNDKTQQNVKSDITRIEQDTSFEIYSDVNDPNIDIKKRILISKYIIIIKILAFNNLVITEQRISALYDMLLSYKSGEGMETIENESLYVFNDPEVMQELGSQLVQSEKMRG